MKVLKFFIVVMLVDLMIAIYKSKLSRSSLASILLWFCEFIVGEIDEGWMYLFLDSFLRQSDGDMDKILEDSEYCHGYMLMATTHTIIFR